MGLVNPGNTNPEDVYKVYYFFYLQNTTKQRELRSHQMKHNTIKNKWMNERIDTQVDTCKTLQYIRNT